jgi:hypothetical protein
MCVNDACKMRGVVIRPAPLPSSSPVPRVPQEHPNGCGIACLAMVSGRPYGEVAAAFSDEAIAGGLSDYGVMWWLNRERFWSRRSWLDTPGVATPTTGLALLLTQDSHWVVMHDGVVLDPARTEPLPRYTWSQAIEVRR